MNRMHKRLADGREQGFTLIELLIVIVILGILAGIVTFGVAQFRTDSTASCNAANAEILKTANAAYNAKNGGTATLNETQLRAAGYLDSEVSDCT